MANKDDILDYLLKSLSIEDKSLTEFVLKEMLSNYLERCNISNQDATIKGLLEYSKIHRKNSKFKNFDFAVLEIDIREFIKSKYDFSNMIIEF
jgi:hypothetical protein